MRKNDSLTTLNRVNERWSFRQPQPSKQLIHTFRELELEKTTEEPPTESPKDLKVISYSNSFSNSDNESLEFINRAQYDYDKLMEHSNGEWKKDSDIIKESLGFYQQQKSRQAEMASGVGEGEGVQSALAKGDVRGNSIPKFVIDEFEEENYRTNSNRVGGKEGEGEGEGEGLVVRQVAGRRRVVGNLGEARSIPQNRNSIRMSDGHFGKKSTGNLLKVKKGEGSGRPEGGLHFKKSVPPGGFAKENQKPNAGIQLTFGMAAGQSQKRRGQSGSILGNILSKYGSKNPVLGQSMAVKRRKEDDSLPKIAHQLGLTHDAGLTDIIDTIKQMQVTIRDLESRVPQERPSNYRTGNSGLRNSHIEPSSEMIDLYNNQRFKFDSIAKNPGTGSSEYKLKVVQRSSLSGIDLRGKRLSDASMSLRRTDKVETTANSRVSEYGVEKGRAVGRLSKLVNISRFSCVASNR